jgi:hypothetical protein
MKGSDGVSDTFEWQSGTVSGHETVSCAETNPLDDYNLLSLFPIAVSE